MIDCIIVENNKTDRRAIERMVSQIKNLNVIKSCDKLSEVRNILLKQPVDLLFLNIIDVGQDGVGLLEDIHSNRPRIIVTSNIRDVAQEAYDIDAIDFILKPVTIPRLIKSLTKALTIKGQDQKENGHNDSSIFLKVNKHFVKVALRDIFLVEALADYVNIHTAAKRYTIHSTMKAMEKELPKKDFVRVHKSYIVRVDQISEVQRDTLTVGKKSVRISNTCRKQLLDRLKII